VFEIHRKSKLRPSYRVEGGPFGWMVRVLWLLGHNVGRRWFWAWMKNHFALHSHRSLSHSHSHSLFVTLYVI